MSCSATAAKNLLPVLPASSKSSGFIATFFVAIGDATREPERGAVGEHDAEDAPGMPALARHSSSAVCSVARSAGAGCCAL